MLLLFGCNSGKMHLSHETSFCCHQTFPLYTSGRGCWVHDDVQPVFFIARQARYKAAAAIAASGIQRAITAMVKPEAVGGKVGNRVDGVSSTTSLTVIVGVGVDVVVEVVTGTTVVGMVVSISTSSWLVEYNSAR